MRPNLPLHALRAFEEGAGVALAPARMFARELQAGMLARPFDVEVPTGSYWLTWLRSRAMSPAMRLFHDWVVGEAGAGG